MVRYLFVAAIAVSAAIVSKTAQAQYLSFTLADALKKSGCSGDTDHDCLDNNREQDLAWVVSPNYYFDEDESCDTGQHHDMKDYFQVRPYHNGGPVSSTWAADSTVKWVRITYFLNYPHDCNTWSGHQGDNERLEVWLQSTDLVTWIITDARMYHHDNYHDYLGTWLALMSANIGSSYLNVAYDEDGHGSWPGYAWDRSECDNSARRSSAGCNFFGCDCFGPGSMYLMHQLGAFILLDVTRNVGGPWPETWNTSLMTNDGTGNMYTEMDVGHGNNREYWTNKGGLYGQFCGWECTTRHISGHCATIAHAEDACAPPLYEKIDYQFFEY